jgi:ankyrin repeat protein
MKKRNKSQPKFSSSFHEAVRAHDTEKLRALISDGFDVNTKELYHRDFGNLTALQYWVIFNIASRLDTKDEDFCEVLLRAGADIKAIDKLKLPHQDYEFAYYANMRILHKTEDYLVGIGVLEYEIVVDSKERLGLLLHSAIAENRLTLVKKCLDTGSDPTFVDITSSDGLISYPKQEGFVGYTPMDKALYDSHSDLLSLLLSHGVNPNSAGDGRLYTPLQSSLRISSLECTEILVLCGAKVTQDDFQYARDDNTFAFLKLAYAMQQYKNDPLQQVIAVIKQNTGRNLYGVANGYFIFWLLNPDKLIKDIQSAKNSKLPDLEKLSTASSLIELHKDAIPVSKYHFINNFILNPTYNRLSAEQSSTVTHMKM